VFEFFKNLFFGKAFKISASKIAEYEKIKATFQSFPSKSIPETVVVGDDYKRLRMEIPGPFQYKSNKTERPNLAIPTIAYQWFNKGNTWGEIEDYETILKYGMLHGGKRRLCIG